MTGGQGLAARVATREGFSGEGARKGHTTAGAAGLAGLHGHALAPEQARAGARARTGRAPIVVLHCRPAAVKSALEGKPTSLATVGARAGQVFAEPTQGRPKGRCLRDPSLGGAVVVALDGERSVLHSRLAKTLGPRV